MNEWILVAVGMALTVGTGVFVASEFALVNLDRHELEGRRERGERGLTPTITALRHTSTHLSSAQLGITLTTLLTGYTFEPAISSLLESPLVAAGVPDAAVSGIGALAGVLLATLFSMVIGELVPKNFAIAVPLATARLVVPLQLAFTTVFRPVVVLLNGTANRVLRGVGVEPREELSGARTAEELKYLIRHSATEGALNPDDATLLSRTLRFTDLDAGDVMTPRVRMVTVRLGDTAAEVIETSSRTGYSRLPVLADGPDDIVGFVHVKQAFAVAYDARANVTAGELSTQPRRVPETMSAGRLLTELRSGGLQIAVVADEYGGTAGIVTLEDVVEEIVGELQDEHDRFRAGLTRAGRSFTFDATWRPDELLDHTGVEVPDDGDWDTVGGYLTARLDRMPEVGDEVDVPAGSLRVDRVDGPHASRLQFIPAVGAVQVAEEAPR